jgi:hypothetical protein
MGKSMMKSRARILFGIAALVAIAYGASAPQSGSVKRGRNEGTLAIGPSNVIGNGNITAYADITSGYSTQAIRFDPAIGGTIGAGGIIQLSGQVIPLGTKGMGPMEAHLQITYPGNDLMRFFGLAINGDLFLSTSVDTISPSANADRPDYMPSLMPSLVMDADWLSLNKRLPLKTYLYAGMADNPQLLYRYNQIALKAGIEWKMYQHSIFVDGGCGLYKETANKLTRNVADTRYEQYCGWIQPGGRYRLLNRFSILGGVRMALYKKQKAAFPLEPDLFAVSLRLEAPLYYRETNTEAIRTLVFVEQEKEKKQAADSAMARTEGDYFSTTFKLNIPGDKGAAETFDYAKEKQDLIKEREEIQEKMDEIEKILEETGEPGDTTTQAR